MTKLIFKKWNEIIALFLAKNEGIFLTKKHWEIIYLIRKFYNVFNYSPSIKIIIKIIYYKYGNKKGNSIYIYKLFNKNPIYKIHKISGLPKLLKCLN
ncbi:TusE/DsrC/DsvC family sulfur relay protein [Enterobacteriaceae bacterium ET-AT1-13]|nr:TusE/DsrC/DsvC family sulfur relay protein [Enterobacteriaceae bacterium ET-AT1-13]WGS66506.1 TusE/DsrC/DsvC family sulfur relay protein [Enterobacteriaceae bacterium Cmel17]WMC17530.1 MAG: TusE/DsrC/DsvC family sulfur relay protein [Enterobacteriaceae bacterium Cmel21]WMC17737.1 MAG: TusE/DsrC/DsvC family sulfur relay protein [Enterobacteriaceae bacterium PSmelAO3-2]WMC17941.1 MAG: TusE/DsrC/DsvC family sulfur relay protein [Enterobacteriaceae bacterium PSmelAO3-1]WMC18143.1 MAG: TusE/DsrC